MAQRINLKNVSTLPPGLYAVGGNLYLRKRLHTASWVFRYQKGYHRVLRGLGSVDLVPVAEARKAALALRLEVAEHGRVLDTPAPTVPAPAARVKFKQIAEKAQRWYFEMHPAYKDFSKNFISKYRRYAAKALDNRYLDEITREDVAKILKPHWNRDLGVKLRQAIERIYKYAIAKRLYSGTMPTTMKDNLELVLPAPLRKVEHLPSMPWAEVPAFYKALDEFDISETERRFAKLVILTCCRQSEIRTLRSDDVDLEELTAVLRDTKTNDVFKIPLPTQAGPILKGIKSQYVCPQVYKDKPMNRSRIPVVFTKDIFPYTFHGFRATFSTWCAEHAKDRYVREACLQHQIDNAVAAAYQRSDLLDRRRVLMQEWADYVTGTTLA